MKCAMAGAAGTAVPQAIVTFAGIPAQVSVPFPFTVTVKEQVAVLPAASVAVAVTVEVPTLNTEPDTGFTITVAAQLSVTFTV